MAALSGEARQKIARGLMRWWSARRLAFSGFVTDDLYNFSLDTGAVADADNWLDSAGGNPAPATGFNGALSDPFRSNASAVQKYDLLLIVAAVRDADVTALEDKGEYARRIVQGSVN